MNFPENLKIIKNYLAASYTKIGIGGPVDYWIEIFELNELIELQTFCKKENLPLRVLGAGTNVFFTDGGYRGVIAVLRFKKTTIGDDGVTVQAEAGASLQAVQQLAQKAGLTGFEFAAGIPGTVGGAVYGNAGAYGKNVGECLAQAKVLKQNGELLEVSPDFFQFAYRNSALKQNNAILIEAGFKLAPGDPNEINCRVNEILAMRNKKLPPDDWATAGSYFKNLKNPDGTPLPAAKLLDAIGSKQVKVGGMAVFSKHANIFYNQGNATARDLLDLENLLRQRVYEKFRIELEREVIYIE